MRRIQIFIPPSSWSGVWSPLHSLSIQNFGHDIIVHSSEVNKKSIHNFYPGFLKDFLAPRIEDSIKKPSICYATVKEGRGGGQGGPETRAFLIKPTISVFISYFSSPFLGAAVAVIREPYVTDKIFFFSYRICESAIAYDLARLEGGTITREELLKGIPTDFQDSDPHFVEASRSMATKKANLTFSGLGSEAVLSQVTPQPLSHQLKAYSQPKKTQEVAKVEAVVKDTAIDPQGQTLPQRKRKIVSETEEAPKPKRRMTIHGGSHFETNKPGPAQSQPRQSNGAAHKRVLDQTSQSQSISSPFWYLKSLRFFLA